MNLSCNFSLIFSHYVYTSKSLVVVLNKIKHSVYKEYAKYSFIIIILKTLRTTPKNKAQAGGFLGQLSIKHFGLPKETGARWHCQRAFKSTSTEPGLYVNKVVFPTI